MPSRIRRINRLIRAEQEERLRNTRASIHNAATTDVSSLIPYRNDWLLELCRHIEKVFKWVNSEKSHEHSGR